MLPATLDITDTLAESLTFEAALTALDRALLFAVSWHAARNPPADGGEECYVPDLPLRRDLGDMRRPDERWEVARYVRLEHAIMRTDESLPDMSDGVLVPTVPQGSRRVTVAGQRQWLVDERIRRSFETLPGDAVVGVPVSVLAKARSRYTLPLLLRLLAWGAGAYPKKWFRRERDDGFIVLRIPIAEMRAAIGSDPETYPVDVMRKEILPAIDELRTYADLEIDIEAVHAPSLRKKRGGRVMFYDLLVPKVARRVVPLPEPTYTSTAEVVAFRPRANAAIQPFRPRPVPKPAATPAPEDDEFAPPPLPDGDYLPYGDDNPF